MVLPKSETWAITLNQLLFAVETECMAQKSKWGFPQVQTNAGFLAILAEEFGEVAKETVEQNAHITKTGFADRALAANIEKELIQVAAVCVQWIIHNKMGETVKYDGKPVELKLTPY